MTICGSITSGRAAGSRTRWSEGFFGRSYFEARGYGWQTTDDDLRDDTAPIITPLINFTVRAGPAAAIGASTSA